MPFPFVSTKLSSPRTTAMTVTQPFAWGGAATGTGAGFCVRRTTVAIPLASVDWLVSIAPASVKNDTWVPCRILKLPNRSATKAETLVVNPTFANPGRLSRTAARSRCFSEGTAPPMEITEEDAENVPLIDVTLAVIVAGPGAVPLFRMTGTLPLPSVVPVAVAGEPSPGEIGRAH